MRIRSIFILLLTVLLAACSPRVATSFWKIGTEADSTREGYEVIHAEGKTRHCYPIREWEADASVDTYHSLHHHGVAVESREMAYRIYFDRKQTIDIYCKRRPQMELAQSHWYPNDSLLSAGYGDDILRVSGTVGVGSLKLWNGQKQIHIDARRRAQRIVSQTNRRAQIEVEAIEWDVPGSGKTVDMTTRYTMLAEHRDMRCDVFLTDSISGLCTGVQCIPVKHSAPDSETGMIETERGLILYSWGTDWPVNDSAKYAKETVGLAVFVPREYVVEQVSDKQNILSLLRLESCKAGGYTAHYYLTCVGATKETHPVASSAEEWVLYLRRWARALK